MVIKGDIKNAGQIEIRGYVEGSVSAGHLMIHEGGRVFGTVKVDAAEVNGRLQGNVAVKNLISIGSTGFVGGDVRYGQLALASGGDLNADVRNVPPGIAGDLNVVVRKGRSVRVTSADLTAIDPDDKTDALVYRVSNPAGGFVANASASTTSISTFTEADIQAGNILFVHDGAARSGSFDAQVADASGATSGAPITVSVAVI
jgi:cytoskeletal protein CcmA (bactofilin family)